MKTHTPNHHPARDARRPFWDLGFRNLGFPAKGGHHPLRHFPVSGLRRHTPRPGLTAADKSALLITAWGVLWALLIIATATLVSP